MFHVSHLFNSICLFEKIFKNVNVSTKLSLSALSALKLRNTHQLSFQSVFVKIKEKKISAKQTPAPIHIKFILSTKTYVSNFCRLIVITCMYSLWAQATLKSEYA